MNSCMDVNVYMTVGSIVIVAINACFHTSIAFAMVVVGRAIIVSSCNIQCVSFVTIYTVYFKLVHLTFPKLVTVCWVN